MHNLSNTAEKLLVKLLKNHPGTVWVSETQYGPRIRNPF